MTVRLAPRFRISPRHHRALPPGALLGRVCLARRGQRQRDSRRRRCAGSASRKTSAHPNSKRHRGALTSGRRPALSRKRIARGQAGDRSRPARARDPARGGRGSHHPHRDPHPAARQLDGRNRRASSSPPFPRFSASSIPAASAPRASTSPTGWCRPRNPLTARVFVNRMWREFFGTGITKTLDDMGSQGEWPTNPELLDWLAAEFMKPEWQAAGTHAWDVQSRDPHDRHQPDLPPVLHARCAGSTSAIRTTACSRTRRASAWMPRWCTTWRFPSPACWWRSSAAPASSRTSPTATWPP